jgi:hypothetical protein
LIKSEYYQSLCYGNLVQTNVEGASCTHFSEERSLAFCYQQSIPYNRGWVCDKNKTLQGMVCEMKDVSWNANTVTTSTLCNIAPTSHLKEWCQAQLAKPNGVINKEEDTQCENIALPDDKFFCYRKIHRIPSTDLCLSIEDEGVKTLCSNAISGIDEK